MSGELRQYVNTKVVGSWTTPLGTVDILDGAVRTADFVAASNDGGDRWAIEGDGNGNATRTKNSNRVGGIAVTISASSPTNLKLTKLAEADDQLENIVGVLELRDKNGDSKIVMTGAFLLDIPPGTFGASRGVRVWRWACARKQERAGGHNLVG